MIAIVLVALAGVIGVRLLLDQSRAARTTEAVARAEQVAGEISAQIRTARAVAASYASHPDVVALATGEVTAGPGCILGEMTERVSDLSVASIIRDDGSEVARAVSGRCSESFSMEFESRPFIEAAGGLDPRQGFTVLVGPAVSPDTDQTVVSAAAAVLSSTSVLQVEVPLTEILDGDAGRGLTLVSGTNSRIAGGELPAGETPSVSAAVGVDQLGWAVVGAVDDIVPADLATSSGLPLSLVVLGTLGLLAVLVALAVQQRALFHSSRVDPSTGLANRHQLGVAIEEHLRQGQPVTLLMFSMLRFRRVVEVLGHGHGDRMLAEVARRLLVSAPREAVLSRTSEEELAVALVGDEWRPRAEELAEELRRAIVQGLVVDGVPIDLGARVGVAMAPDHARDAAALLRRAASALREAALRRRDVLVYSADLDRDGRHQLTLAGELEQAIQDGSIDIELQPKVSLRDDRVVGLEALARWRRPSGDVPPVDFIELAEATGRIAALTMRVLDRSLEERARLAQLGHDVNVAANLSAVSLSDADLADQVHMLLQRHETPPNRLVLELTETSIMADPALAVDTLTRLRELGVRVSVDDFGTGYSAMSYLTELPVDEVKIDRSFVATEKADLRVVRSVIRLAHDFGLNVVAEGVESAEMLERLRELDCDDAQGFHIARPMGGRELRAWLASRGDANARRTVDTNA